jgi:DNA ligase-associated metallophosphoesterase
MMEFSLNGMRLTALPSGALWWAEQRLLCVSDLHLGKSERMARRAGALLPPYEVAETLFRLEADIDAHSPAKVVCLGDSFDDLAAGYGLDEGARLRLTVLQAGREWVWIEGNHDAGPLDLGGVHLAELALDGLVFRHIAAPNLAADCGEISGHYHPKVRLAGQGLPAFLVGRQRLILPAYGAYTGGMMADRAPLPELMGPRARSLAMRAGRVLEMPL